MTRKIIKKECIRMEANSGPSLVCQHIDDIILVKWENKKCFTCKRCLDEDMKLEASIYHRCVECLKGLDIKESILRKIIFLLLK